LAVLALGPMPDAVRTVVQRLVAQGRRERPDPDDRLNGFLLTGGPAGCSYLDADGQVWNWCVFDESVELVTDGPLKVGMVAFAAERVPALAAWLPVRPPGAADCHPCRASGWLLPPLPRVQCPECNGMGWVAEPQSAPDTSRESC
jgi:hypothetical protein